MQNDLVPDPSESRLPKWAQLKLFRLREDVKSLKDQLSTEPSPIYIRVGTDERLYIPQLSHTDVSFELPSGAVFAVRIADDDALRIRLDHGRRRRLLIEPEVGNVIRLTAEERPHVAE